MEAIALNHFRSAGSGIAELPHFAPVIGRRAHGSGPFETNPASTAHYQGMKRGQSVKGSRTRRWGSFVDVDAMRLKPKRGSKTDCRALIKAFQRVASLTSPATQSRLNATRRWVLNGADSQGRLILSSAQLVCARYCKYNNQNRCPKTFHCSIEGLSGGARSKSAKFCPQQKHSTLDDCLDKAIICGQ